MLSKGYKIFCFLLFFISSLFVLTLAHKASAVNSITRPYYVWGKQIASSNVSVIYSIFEDTNGNLFYMGRASGNVDFGVDWGVSDPHNLSVNSIFLTKIDKNGTYSWTKVISNSYVSNYRANIDKENNIYIYGVFSGTVNFAADWGGTDTKASVGSPNSFITKINPDGSYGYTKILTSTGLVTLSTLIFDKDNNMYIGGGFQSTVDFGLALGTSPDTKTSSGSYDVFVTKINADGTYAWTKRMGGTGQDNAYYNGNNLAVDSHNNVYITGFYNGTVNFVEDWGGNVSKTSSGAADIFILKILNNGNFGTVHVWGGSNSDDTPNIIVDQEDNCYIATKFRSTINFAADWGGNDTKSSLQSIRPDISITKISSTDEYVWTHVLASLEADDPRAIAIDRLGNLYIGGLYNGDVNFAADWGGNDFHSGSASTDAFITKINLDGTYGWTKTYGISYDDTFWGFTFIRQNELYLTGCFAGEVNIGATFGSDDIKTSANIATGLVMKIVDAEVKINTTAANSFTLYENGAAATYAISLNTVPTSNVIINISAPGLNLSSTQLTFTPTNWQTPQTIAVSAPNNNILTGNLTKTISYTVTTDDTDFANTALPNITVTVVDDEKPAVKGVSANTPEVTPTISETVMPTETVVPTITQSTTNPDTSPGFVFTVVDKTGSPLPKTRVRIGNLEFVTDIQARIIVPSQLKNQEIKIFINNKEVRGIISENKIIAVSSKSVVNVWAICVFGGILVIGIFFILFVVRRRKSQEE